MTHPRYSFIVRIWFELEPNLEGFAPALRGSVQQVGGEQTFYFTSLPRLIHALETIMDGQGGGPHAASSPFSS
jgi:hypothetical protein